MKKRNKYELRRRGRSYIVYRMEYSESGSEGSPVYFTNEYEEARKELYKLNGWKYQPKKQWKIIFFQACIYFYLYRAIYV